MLLISALAWSAVAVSQRDFLEKSSVRVVEPMPGRISGVGGFWVAKTPSVGVAEAGNQTMVGVGCGVSVKRTGVEVTCNSSKTEQEVPNPTSRIRWIKRKNKL